MEKLLKIFKSNLVLIFILLLGFGLRFYQLGKIPSSLNRDEPAIGYNAYSILKTGEDEWGTKFPLTFKSFGDYKSPLYIYLTTISITLFGLNEFSVRFWAATAGFLTIAITYLLIKRLLGKKHWPYSLAVALILTIVPWQIFYSRFSFEANLALLFNAIILYFFASVRFFKIDLRTFILILATLLTYSTSLIIWPLFLVILFAWILKDIYQKKNHREFFKILVFCAIFSFVFYKQILMGGQKSRITIFADPQIRLTFNEERTLRAQKNLWQTRIFYNQYLYYGKIFLVNVFKSLSPNFLFLGGGAHPWHQAPGASHFYFPLLFLILIGFFSFIKNRFIDDKNKIFLLLFFMISIIPSAITTDSPHATRLLNFFWILTIFAGFGLSWLVKRFRLIGIILCVLVILNFFQFIKLYFVDYKQNPPLEILPGLKETIVILNKEKFPADRIIFDNNSDGSYAYLLFYTQYPPTDFIKKVKRYIPDTGGLEWIERLDNYIFVNNPKPDSSFKEVYILHGDSTLGQKEIAKVKNSFTGKIYYTIATNFFE